MLGTQQAGKARMREYGRGPGAAKPRRHVERVRADGDGAPRRPACARLRSPLTITVRSPRCSRAAWQECRPGVVRLLRARGPDMAALAVKIELAIAHEVWELGQGAARAAAILGDARRLGSGRARRPGSGAAPAAPLALRLESR